MKGHKKLQGAVPIWTPKSRAKFDIRFGNRRVAPGVANGLVFLMFFGLTPTLASPNLAGGRSPTSASTIEDQT